MQAANLANPANPAVVQMNFGTTGGVIPGAEYNQQQAYPQNQFVQPNYNISYGQPVYGQQPIYGGQQPIYGDQQPIYGQQQPIYGGQQQPIYGDQQPIYGNQQPIYGGQQQPIYGGQQQPIY
eukprot:CAMPEP_0176425936 /NCGR_PEP_ID=MMETSP0127-20121128/11661_1 /TAXON_ID=938130 /ORGANISM="Platyophrya macrostoma, Strain WH" /LENGTH=121 /DNA_ID=CAMNT_0017807143 /DNA_START=328 /DNA_END=693 /DNA_ORIENTATION=-